MPRPEILAPAGDRDALAAALAAGADAVYFGLDDGFNARARAANFPSDGLAEIVAQVHRGGAKAYVAMNTLVFEPELAIVEELVRRVATAGVDAIIVQDPAVARIARAACPSLELHGSTQMTASSAAAAELLAELGLSRIVVPRELSVDEIGEYARGTKLELEVFVHGALCVAWSGQCLSSEAWGGRSANRGQCAQACRLPYSLVVDGERRELGDVEYLLSPKDLVALDAPGAIDRLAEIGVASLKIEGRLKGPAYVATATAQYRRAVEPGWQPASETPMDRAALEVAYSRGGSRGFLAGADHQVLVEGRFPRHRGIALGRVDAIEGDSVHVVADVAQRPLTGGAAGERDAARAVSVQPSAGMGVVFDRPAPPSGAAASPKRAGLGGAGMPEHDEQGGPIFGVRADERGAWLRFGTPGPDLRRVAVGDFVWASSDPRVTRAGERAAAAGVQPLGRIAVDLCVTGELGAPLEVTASVPRDGFTARATTTAVLAAATGAGLSRELVADKLGSFGGTAFRLGQLVIADALAQLHVPVRELKELRRALAAALDAQLVGGRTDVATSSVLPALAAELAVTARAAPPMVVPLVRTDAQLDAVLAAGAREVELDWMELVGLAKAAARARAAGAHVVLATPRVQKPGEDKIDAHFAKLAPDALLARSWAAIATHREAARAAPVHADFSLNVTNSLTAAWLLAHGVETITAAHDLDRDQLFALLAAAPRGRIAVTVHHHIPTFHTEHCVYAHLLSSGADYRSCGRPCERHAVSLRDRVGLVHPVIVDVGCRNTVFNAQAQSAAQLVPELIAAGVSRLRVELVRESADEARAVYAAYAALAGGRCAPADAVRASTAHEQFGVTRGTMRTLTVLR